MENNVKTAVKGNTDTAVSFDRKEWMRQKNAERESAYRMIDEMADLIKTRTWDLRNFLELMVRFPKYSVGNLLLVAAQMPDSTDLRTFDEWRSLGTSIKKGQTGIMMLEPGREYTRADGTAGVRYNVKRLFDISQTRALSNPQIPFPLYASKVIEGLFSDPACKVELDDAMSGRKGDDAVYDPQNGTVRVSGKLKPSEIIPPVAREIARAYMSAGDALPDHIDETALCASYVFCRRKGAGVESIDLSEVTAGISDMEPRQIRNMMSRVKDISSGMREQMNSYFRQQRQRAEQEQQR